MSSLTSRTAWTCGLLLAAALGAVACGGGDPGAPDANGTGGPDAPTPPDHSSRYFPRKVGTVWNYHVTDLVTGATGDKDTVVEAYEDIGAAHGHAGTLAFRTRIGKLDGFNIVWEDYVGDVAVRYASEGRDLSDALVDSGVLQPYRIKIDETTAHLVNNATYSETFDETTTDVNGTVTNTKTATWLVVNVAETVTVPAGTYNDVLHVRRTNTASNKTKDYWFVRGVGKIKEIGVDGAGTNATQEELNSYTPGA